MKMRLDFIVNSSKIIHIKRVYQGCETVDKFRIEKIELPQGKQNAELIERLYDLGLHPGLEIEIVAKVSFSSVTVIQFDSTRIALNAEEFSCLHGHS